jgi:D-amino-acid dehydrogenase
MALRRAAGAAVGGLGAVTAYRYQGVKARERQLPQQILPLFTAEEGGKKQDGTKQRVVIIGAGVVGVSTAYKLAQRGHSVVVLEPAPQPGEECSHCAAGGMSRQNVVVDRGTWTAVLKSIAPNVVKKYVFGDPDPSSHFDFFQIDWTASLSDPFFLRWAWTFTKTSFFPDEHQQEKQQDMLDFTKYAVDDMVKMFEDRWDDMKHKAGYNTRGSLALSYDDVPVTAPASAAAEDTASKDKEDAHPSGKNTLEPNRRLESTELVLQEEPSLKFQARPPTSAKLEYEAKAASSGRFAKELARRCATNPKLDVTFHYETKVQGITTTTPTDDKKPRISQLKTNRGVMDIPDDVHVVVTAGAWNPHVLALMDLYAPVYPLKGYAMSVSAKEALAKLKLKPQDLPSRIVCDKYMYTTRLGDEIRITSIGEFSEWNTAPTPQVDQDFRVEAIRQFPQLEPLIHEAKTYCGHRPYVSDGILLLGACSDTYDKLYVSCGPGSNGWKLAMGSGEVIARLISGETLDDMKQELGFDATAFSPAGRVLHAPLFAKVCRARWNV